MRFNVNFSGNFFFLYSVFSALKVLNHNKATELLPVICHFLKSLIFNSGKKGGLFVFWIYNTDKNEKIGFLRFQWWEILVLSTSGQWWHKNSKWSFSPSYTGCNNIKKVGPLILFLKFSDFSDYYYFVRHNLDKKRI